jgi:CCR4-NOT transcriptional complex subunit CAF120
MMTGQGMPAQGMPMMGYPGMMPGYNPQHMYVAQQAAAQAYQQAMMAFSNAGSQVGGSQIGGEGGGGSPGGQQPPMNPMMTGGNMSMFDPRMSMMGMPMMSPQMGLPMQMTGMSGFDPRFTPNGTPMESPLAPPQGQFSSRTSSPGRGSASPHRGSPLIRPVDHNDTGGRVSSRPTSPKP